MHTTLKPLRIRVTATPLPHEHLRALKAPQLYFAEQLDAMREDYERQQRRQILTRAARLWHTWTDDERVDFLDEHEIWERECATGHTVFTPDADFPTVATCHTCKD